jgi:hypothetical protein
MRFWYNKEMKKHADKEISIINLTLSPFHSLNALNLKPQHDADAVAMLFSNHSRKYVI